MITNLLPIIQADEYKKQALSKNISNFCYFRAMYKSKFIRLYQTITLAEKRLLKKWLESPVYNQREDIVKVFEFLSSRKTLSTITLQKERAFKYIYPKQKYDVYQLNYLLSYAYEVLEGFIENLESVSNENSLKINKIRAYKKRNLPKQAHKILQKATKALQKQPQRNSEYQLEALQLEVERFELAGTTQRTQDNNLPQIFEHLADFFVISTLQYACIAATHSNVYKVSYDIPMLEVVLQQAEKAEASPIAKLYYYAYQALTNPEQEDYYINLKTHFEQYKEQLPPKEQQGILLVTINYAIKRSHTGTLFYIQEALDLYKIGLETKLLLNNNTLSKFTYKNIVALGLKLEQFDWIEAFIEMYISYLPTANQANYKHYATAKLFFSKEEYNNCLGLLTQVEYDDLFLALDARMMLLKIYYEEASFDALEALLHSFTIFLQRKGIMSYHKNNYQNIIKITQKLLYLSPNSSSLKQLQTDIETTQPLTEKKWLIVQLNKLR